MALLFDPLPVFSDKKMLLRPNPFSQVGITGSVILALMVVQWLISILLAQISRLKLTLSWGFLPDQQFKRALLTKAG